MPPAKRDSIRDYFTYNAQSNKSTCTIKVTSDDDGSSKPCKGELTGSKSSVLQKHVRTRHPTVFAVYRERRGASPSSKREKQELTSCTTYGNQNINAKSISKLNKPMTGHMKKKSVSSSSHRKCATVRVCRDQLMSGIIQMVTVDERPFAWLEDEGFRKIVEPLYKVFDLRVDSYNIVQHIRSYCEVIKEKLQQLVRNKLVNIKIDCVAQMDRTFIGVNILFMHDNRIITFTLNTIEVDLNTDNGFEEMILNELERYEIKPSQIYSVSFGDGVRSSGGDACVLQEPSISLAVADEEINDTLPKEDLDAKLSHVILNSDWNKHNIISVKCAVHVIEQSVRDTLKNCDRDDQKASYLYVIERTRSVVKALNEQNVIILVHEQSLQKPVLDLPSKWISTYYMLYVLFHNFQSYCKELENAYDELRIAAEDWLVIEEIVECLKPCAKATEKLQREQLTLTDVYRIVNVCQMETSDIGRAMSADLVENLVKQRDDIFNTETFLSCMFLDPRFNFELNDADKERAVAHLCQIFTRCATFSNSTPPVKNPDADSGDDINDDDAVERRYERYLREKRRSMGLVTSKSASEFEFLLRSFSPDELKPRDDVLQWWAKTKERSPELYEVAKVVFSIPGSQISVKKLFAQLQFIQDPSRSVVDDYLDDVLFLKNNLVTFDSL